jgi:hypothetical protein
VQVAYAQAVVRAEAFMQRPLAIILGWSCISQSYFCYEIHLTNRRAIRLVIFLGALSATSPCPCSRTHATHTKDGERRWISQAQGHVTTLDLGSRTERFSRIFPVYSPKFNFTFQPRWRLPAQVTLFLNNTNTAIPAITIYRAAQSPFRASDG